MTDQVFAREHKHLIARIKVDNPLYSQDQIDLWIKETVKSIDMNIMAGPYFAYASADINKGWTGIAIIEFSHVSLHIWENENLIEFDVFSCKRFDVNAVVEQLKKFGIRQMALHYLDRDKNFGELEKLYVVYKTTNLINDKYYIGVHSFVNLNDQYLGSGKILKQAIKKYGKDNFKREDIKFFYDEKEAYQFEAELVKEEQIKNRNCYNLILGGRQSFVFVDPVWITDGENNKFVNRGDAISNYIGLGWKYGRVLSEYHKQKLKERKPYVRKFTPLAFRKPQKKRKPVSEETKEKIRKNHRFNNGAVVSLETRKKLSAAGKGKSKPGTTNNRKWYNNGFIERLFIPNNIADGWMLGRLPKGTITQ